MCDNEKLPEGVWKTYGFYCTGKNCGKKVLVQGFLPTELLCSWCYEKSMLEKSRYERNVICTKE